MSICKIRSLDRSQCSSFCIYCRDDLLFDVYQTVMMVLVVSLRHLLIAFAFVKVNDQPFINCHLVCILFNPSKSRVWQGSTEHASYADQTKRCAHQKYRYTKMQTIARNLTKQNDTKPTKPKVPSTQQHVNGAGKQGIIVTLMGHCGRCYKLT